MAIPLTQGDYFYFWPATPYHMIPSVSLAHTLTLTLIIRASVFYSVFTLMNSICHYTRAQLTLQKNSGKTSPSRPTMASRLPSGLSTPSMKLTSQICIYCWTTTPFDQPTSLPPTTHTALAHPSKTMFSLYRRSQASWKIGKKLAWRLLPLLMTLTETPWIVCIPFSLVEVVLTHAYTQVGCNWRKEIWSGFGIWVGQGTLRTMPYNSIISAHVSMPWFITSNAY